MLWELIKIILKYFIAHLVPYTIMCFLKCNLGLFIFLLSYQLNSICPLLLYSNERNQLPSHFVTYFISR